MGVTTGLGAWCKTQRQNKKKNKLSQDRIDKLDNIGFDWGKSHSDDDKWDIMYQALIDYKDSNNNEDPPSRYNDEITIQNCKWKGEKVTTSLGKWCDSQRA